MNNADLKTYLSKITETEVRKYEIEKIIRNLEGQKQRCLSQINQSTYLESEERKWSLGDTKEILFLSFVLGVVGAVVGIIIRILIDFLSWSTPYTFPELIKSGAFWGFSLTFLCSFFRLLASVHSDISEHNSIVQKENKKKEERNIQIFSEAQSAKKQVQIIDVELSKLTSNYSECLSILKRLYAFNIVYPKYHGLIPISSFYEYLCSGRCYQLEGHEGAYNIYENELLAKTITDRLDIIIEQLESIKKNQYMLYTALQTSNENAFRFMNLMNVAIDKLEDIDNSQQIIAYNTQLNVANTETIKWITTCDYLNI